MGRKENEGEGERTGESCFLSGMRLFAVLNARLKIEWLVVPVRTGEERDAPGRT